MSKLRGTAIHEAGHAVAAFFLGHRIRRVSIVAAKDSLGHVMHTPLKFASEGMFDDSLRGIDRAEKRIVILYAGPLAERKLKPRSHWRRGASDDLSLVSEFMGRLQGPDDKYNRLYANLLWRRAELLVEQRWKEIKAVADALLERRKLDQEGLAEVVKRANGINPARLAKIAAQAVRP